MGESEQQSEHLTQELPWLGISVALSTTPHRSSPYRMKALPFSTLPQNSGQNEHRDSGLRRCETCLIPDGTWRRTDWRVTCSERPCIVL